MKTTIEITDSLLKRARRLAESRGITLRALVEQSLRESLAAEKANNNRKPFQLADGSVSGQGVQEGIQEGNWQQIRALIYEGRGG